MIYVLCAGWDYETQDVLGAYASLAEAQDAGRVEGLLDGYHYVAAYEVELGAAAGDRAEVWYQDL
jgi:hypothetical protein